MQLSGGIPVIRQIYIGIPHEGGQGQLLGGLVHRDQDHGVRQTGVLSVPGGLADHQHIDDVHAGLGIGQCGGNRCGNRCGLRGRLRLVFRGRLDDGLRLTGSHRGNRNLRGRRSHPLHGGPVNDTADQSRHHQHQQDQENDQHRHAAGTPPGMTVIVFRVASAFAHMKPPHRVRNHL